MNAPHVQVTARLRSLATSLRSRLFVRGRDTKLLGLEVAEERVRKIRSAGRERRLLFYYLLGDAFPLLLLARRAGGRLDADCVTVCGDTWMGRIVSSVLARLGRRTLPFRFGHEALSLRDVKALVREPAPLTIAADGRGPYGHVHPDLRRLVEGRDAIAVPVSVRAARSLRIWLPGGIAVPLPGARLAIAIGEPVAAGGKAHLLSTEELEEGLREARAAALLLLDGSGPRG